MVNERVNKNKRESSRAFFTLDEGVSAQLNVPGSEQRSVPVTLLSIGSGGVGLLAYRFKLPAIGIGDRLTLTDIRAPQPLGTIDRADISVKYMAGDTCRFKLSLGCEFVESSPNFNQRVRNFVKNRLRKLGFDSS